MKGNAILLRFSVVFRLYPLLEKIVVYMLKVADISVSDRFHLTVKRAESFK